MDTTPPLVDQPARKLVSWRLFWLLALMVLFASLLLLPYALQLLQAGKPEAANQASAFRVSATAATVVQSIFLYWPMTLLGLFAASRLGLGVPYLEAWIEGRSATTRWVRILRPAAIIGFGGGILLLAISAALSPLTAGELARLNASLPKTGLPNAWQGFLGATSAGINEEIILRLFLLSGLAWIIQWVTTRRKQGRPHFAILWTANILSAVIFGLLHLPNLSAINVPASPYWIFYLIGLNGLAGLGFGWLFWTFGLESAMLAHFFMDIVLHVLVVLAQGLVQ